MIESPVVTTIVDFATFVSTTYGMGHALLDTAILVGALLVSAILIQMMQFAGLGFDGRNREYECLASISDLLNEMSLQIAELRHAVIHELEKYRGEVGYIKQELDDLWRAHSFLRRNKTSTGRTTEIDLQEIFGSANDGREKPPFR